MIYRYKDEIEAVNNKIGEAVVKGETSCEYYDMLSPFRWTTEDNNDAVTTYCCYDDYYYHAPISEILALPERDLRKEN